ncbi:MAG: flagellar hook-basal body complex protein FliE [Deltaproteobacteria bacterium]|nr:flagellar hook-basal body complex protein FliE [Deltaproteobacteria bacterium]
MKITPAATILDLFPPKSSAAQTPTGSGSFQQILADVDKAHHQADAQVRQTLLGKGDLHEAMLALEKANLGLKLLVQVRNKLLQAYEELSRMPM